MLLMLNYQNNRFNTDIYDMQNDFNNVKKQGFTSIKFLTNQLNSLKKKIYKRSKWFIC